MTPRRLVHGLMLALLPLAGCGHEALWPEAGASAPSVVDLRSSAPSQLPPAPPPSAGSDTPSAAPPAR